MVAELPRSTLRAAVVVAAVITAVAEAKTRFRAVQKTVVEVAAVVIFTLLLPPASRQPKVARTVRSTTLAELQVINLFLASA